MGKIVRAKVDLAGDTAAQWDDALHEWAGRARTMATDMLEGRSLNMELMSMMTSMCVHVRMAHGCMVAGACSMVCAWCMWGGKVGPWVHICGRIAHLI